MKIYTPSDENAICNVGQVPSLLKAGWSLTSKKPSEHTYIVSNADAVEWLVTNDEEVPNAVLNDKSALYAMIINVLKSWSTPSTQTPGETDPVNKWPKGALKQLLDELHIAYPADASITVLANLVPDTHQHHIKEEAPAHTWTNARVVTWLEKEGANVPELLKDNQDALFEMVSDIIKLKAGLPL